MARYLSEFEELYRSYRQKFLLIARMYVHDELMAEDIVAESFISFWEKRESLSVEVSPASYILGTVKKKCLEYLRSLRIREKVHGYILWDIEQNIQVLSDPEATKRLFSAEVAAIFRACVADLPDRTRKVYLASREDKMTYSQIADSMGLSVRQVTRDMQKALGALREALKDYLV